jgi:leucyl aminopeptidase
MMVDVATLTGAVIVGLGHFAAAVMSHNSDIPKRMGSASCATGELIWELPLWQDYVDVMKGTHADLTNASARREAGSITAGGFLSKFVGDVPWAHIDIAGTAWGAKGIPYYNGDYVTGWGVRLLTQWLLNEAEETG